MFGGEEIRGSEAADVFPWKSEESTACFLGLVKERAEDSPLRVSNNERFLKDASLK
jgi:hypothetical protein